jgi:hypothetical protein
MSVTAKFTVISPLLFWWVIIFVMTFIFTVIWQNHSSSITLQFMNNFMGLYFMLFGLFKLKDLGAFVNKFIKYDSLASKSRLYALSYPFIELVIGALLLSDRLMMMKLAIIILNLIIIIITAITITGSTKALKYMQNVECACLGSVTPSFSISKYTLLDNLIMLLMATGMIIMA